MIRPATSNDIGSLLLLAEQMHAESDYRRFPFAVSKMAALFNGLLAGAGCIFVAERDGQVVGLVAGYCEENWFTTARVAGEYGLFVTQAARGASIAAGLMNAFRAWAEGQGADQIVVGVTTGVHTERTAALYERMGFRRSGIVFEWKGD